MTIFACWFIYKGHLTNKQLYKRECMAIKIML